MSPTTDTREARAGAAQYEVVIVGAGFGGMGAAIQLARMGIRSVLMLERADDLGGTWHLNNYPGLSVDIASVTYSYSFEPNPGWSRLFAPGAELKAYASRVANKYNLRSLMRFNAAVEQVVYDEAAKIWTISISGQPPVTARVLILATGYLSRPQRPAIPGIDDFQGKVIHSAQWDHSYELRGKRAAVIGTGATAVQLVPELAKVTSQLDVYQRTPIWVAPKIDPKVPTLFRALFQAVPGVQRGLRMINDVVLEIMTTAVLQHQRLPIMTKIAEWTCRAHLARQVKSPALRRKLTPDYPFGCKRPTFSNGYYRVFNRGNVALVSEPIERIEADGIVTRDGKKRLIDTLVLATGFRVWERDSFHSIVGKGGVELRDHWEQNRYEAYEGITIPGFPNLFNLPSPYSYTGLSYFETIESQMKHIARCLGEMRRRSASSFEVDRGATDQFVARMNDGFKNSILSPGLCNAANSYYFDRHGAPSLIRPTSTRSAHRRHAQFPLADYHFE